MTGRGGWRYGAGRSSTHVRVEGCRHIDIRHFHREGMINNGPWMGQWLWRDLGTRKTNSFIDVVVNPPHILLTYQWQGRRFAEHILVIKTVCHLGGSRSWFSCSGCHKRVAKLHFLDGGFRCRHCHDLRYRTQSLCAIERLHAAKGKLESRLGPGWKRPPGMHKTTRTRLVDQIIEYEEAIDDLLYQALLNDKPQTRW